MLKGMGNAGVAMEGVIDGVFYNPANIMVQRKNLIDAIYSFNNKFGITGYYVNSLGIQLPTLVFGQQFSLYSALTVEQESITGLITKQNLGLSLGLIDMGNIHIGVGLHDLRISFADGNFPTQNQFYADIGVIVKYLSPLKFGVIFNTLDFTKDTFYNNLKLGFSYIFEKYALIMNGDIKLTNDPFFKNGYLAMINVGLEKMITPGLFLRAGVKNEKITLGLGVAISKLKIDYAYDMTTLNDHQVSLKYKF